MISNRVLSDLAPEPFPPGLIRVLHHFDGGLLRSTVAKLASDHISPFIAIGYIRQFIADAASTAGTDLNDWAFAVGSWMMFPIYQGQLIHDRQNRSLSAELIAMRQKQHFPVFVQSPISNSEQPQRHVRKLNAHGQLLVSVQKIVERVLLLLECYDWDEKVRTLATEMHHTIPCRIRDMDMSNIEL